MKLRTLFTLAHLLTVFYVFGQQTLNVSGRVVDTNGEPLPGSIVQVFWDEENATSTVGIDGQFSLQIIKQNPDSDVRIVVSFIGFETIEETFTADQSLEGLLFEINESDEQLTEVVVTSFASANSFWFGAEATYNFLGDNEFANFIGSAPLIIDNWVPRSLRDESKLDLYLLGNISNVLAQQSEDEEKNANVLAQGNQGISLAISPVYEITQFQVWNSTTVLRAYAEIYGKYNVIELDSATSLETGEERLTFPNGGFALGIEWDGPTFENDNKPVHVYASLYNSIFDRENFEIIYESNLRSIFGFESGIIIPIPRLPFGVKVSYNVSNAFDSYLAAALVIK